MCEIAILDPERFTPSRLTDVSLGLYNSMGSSLGVVFIKDTGTAFDYAIHKSLTPDEDTLETFIREHQDESARVIVHGRLATHGEKTVAGAHPIEMDCAECDIDYILHNGVVYDHDKHRHNHEQHGHEYETAVDSEVIAHGHETVPESFDESRTDLFGREPSYILLNSDRAYIYTNGQYSMTGDGEMAQAYRRLLPVVEQQANYTEVILTPGDA